MRRPRGGFVGRTLDRLEEYTGVTVVDAEHLRVQEALARESFMLAEELESLGYVALNFAGGRPNEPTAYTRRKWAAQARVVWLADPLAGAAVELRNEFTFGRGVPKPRAKSKKVQEVLDDFWDDAQNQRVLTSFGAQMRFGNSLQVQSNVFFTMFDDGDDGKVKLSFLNHDDVHGAYTDPENRQRVLFFTASDYKQEWDFANNGWKPATGQPIIRYYEAWGAVEDALIERGMPEEDAANLMERYRAAGERDRDEEKAEGATEQEIERTQPFDTEVGLILPPPQRLGAGKVYHVAENRDMEMTFGVPRMRRTMRWYTAYNEFMGARVDMMMGAAAFIAKKKVEAGGTPGQIEKMASQAMRASGNLRTVAETAREEEEGVKAGPRPAAIAGETAGVSLESLRLDSGAGNAQTDGQMLRAQASAGDRFPQHYLGDVGSANLATATSMELPVLKHVEAFMELAEGVFRWGLDRQLDRAIETNKLNPNEADTPDEEPTELRSIYSLDVNPEVEESEVVSEQEINAVWRINGRDVVRPTRVKLHADTSISYDLVEAVEDKPEAEQQTGLNLDYEFAMPSPLRRLMGDLVSAASSVAQFADPNGENTELTRTLLAFVFAEAFEMPDAADAVDRIFPKGYVPLSVQAMQAQVAPPDATGGGPPRAGDANFFGPGAGDQPTDPTAAHPYGTKTSGTLPEQMVSEAAVEEDEWDRPPLVTVGRNGQPVAWSGVRKNGTRGPVTVNGRTRASQREFDKEVRRDTMDALAALDMGREQPLAPQNGR